MQFLSTSFTGRISSHGHRYHGSVLGKSKRGGTKHAVGSMLYAEEGPGGDVLMLAFQQHGDENSSLHESTCQADVTLICSRMMLGSITAEQYTLSYR